MPYELFLALRYLRSRRNRRLARVTALAAITGIAIGVGALIVAMALANGFRDEMQDKILRGTAHLTVMRADGQPMMNYQELATKIGQLSSVASAAGTTYDGAVASGPKGSAYAVLRGIDRESTQATNEAGNWLIAGSFDPLFEVHSSTRETSLPAVVLGAELATRTGLGIGAVAELYPASSSMRNSSKRMVRVAGIFRAGLFEYDSTWIYLSLDAAAAMTGNSHTASLISVQLRDADEVKHVAANIRETLGSSYTTVDWQQANRPLFTALALERRMGLFIIALIIFIATLNITTMLILIVVERRRDIAILNTMGATSGSVMLLFVIEGAVIGAFGALCGMALGIVACAIGNRYKVISLPADVYSISGVPLNAHFSEMAVAALLAFLLSVVATIYPARAAARMRPGETLRDAG